MKLNKQLLFAGIITLAALSPVSVLAKNAPPNRYFVKSLSSVWKNSFNARHVFDTGFSADLSDFQLRVAKLFGISLEPISRFSILPENQAPAGGVRQALQPSHWNTDLFSDIQAPEQAGSNQPVPGEIKAPTPPVVAILDTGIQKDHPDLADRVAECFDLTQKKSIVEDSCDDVNGHGTHVAGIIAADGGKEGTGLVGMAPSAKLMVLKVCDAAGSCWADDVAAGIRLAAKEGANIINISLGSDTDSKLVREVLAVDADPQDSLSDIVVVAAAGNDGPYEESIDYPAAYSLSAGVVSVGAMDKSFHVPDWSSRGRADVSEDRLSSQDSDGLLTFSAPGVDIESTWNNGGYAVLSGTSMSAPHVAGLAARLWNAVPDSVSVTRAEAIRAVLAKSTDSRNFYGLGYDEKDVGLGIPLLPILK